MRAKLVSVFCICLVLAVASTAYAQLKAGSDEDKAFRKITAEKNADTQSQMLQDFAKQFPQSKILPQVWSMLLDIATEKNDHTKIAEYGEQAVKADPQNNVSAYLAVSRVYAMDGKNLDVAVSYAQKAVENVDKMKAQPTPPNYTDAEWKDIIKQNEAAAQGQLTYAKAVKK